MPVLDPSAIAGALWSSEDSVIDIHALLGGYLDGARRCGAEIETGVEVLGARMVEGQITGVKTSAGPIDAPIVVNAAGAWAGARHAEEKR